MKNRYDMKGHDLLLLIPLLVFVCCTKTADTPQPTTHEFCIDALMDELSEDETKASGQNAIRLKWDSGDKISVVNVTTGKTLGGELQAAITDGTGYSARFSGTLTGTINTNDVLAFIYPSQNFTSDATFTTKNIDYSTQTTEKPALIMIGHYTAGSTSGDFTGGITVSFGYQMSFLRINLSELPVSTGLTSVKVTGLNDILTLSISGGKLISTPSSSKGYKEYTYSTSTTDKGSQTIFMGIIATSATDRNIIVRTSTSSYTAPFSGATLSANKSYNTNASGFVSSFLTFKDANVKSVCLTNFDRNSDGQISFLEAAAVTDLGVSTKAAGGNPFPTSILNFAELQFFRGLSAIPSFQGYNLLKIVAIPSQITSLSGNTFKNCSSLEGAIFTSDVPPTLGSDVFTGCSSDLKIYVPSDAVTTYKNEWPSLSSKIDDIAIVGSDFGLEGWGSGGNITGSAD